MTRISWKADADGIVRMGEGASRQQGGRRAVLEATCVPETFWLRVFVVSSAALVNASASNVRPGVAPGCTIAACHNCSLHARSSRRICLFCVGGKKDLCRKLQQAGFSPQGSCAPGAFFIDKKGEGKDV